MSKGTVNKVILVGRLGADPEVKTTSTGMTVGHLRLATNETFKDKATGQNQDQTEWHRVVLFGKTAEIAGQYLKKGSSVYIEGRIRTSKWQDQAGQDRYSTEVVANEMQFIGGRENSSGDHGGEKRDDYSDRSAPAASPSTISNHNEKFNDDDIPF